MTLAAAVAALFLLPAAAGAQTYPEPKEPGKIAPKPKGPFKTHTVCKSGKCDFKTIQKAVNKAKAGDKIVVRKGVYKEQVTISARFIEDNPGRWLYHCHVFSHQDAGMAGWYMVSP